MKTTGFFALLLAIALLAGGLSFWAATAAAGCESCEQVIMLVGVVFLYIVAFGVLKIDSSLTGESLLRRRRDKNE